MLVQLAMPGDIARRLPATGRVADMYSVAQVQLLCQRGNVRSVVVHVMAIAYLRGAAVAASIMRESRSSIRRVSYSDLPTR